MHDTGSHIGRGSLICLSRRLLASELPHPGLMSPPYRDLENLSVSKISSAHAANSSITSAAVNSIVPSLTIQFVICGGSLHPANQAPRVHNLPLIRRQSFVIIALLGRWSRIVLNLLAESGLYIFCGNIWGQFINFVEICNMHRWGPRIKYFTLFLANFYPLPLSHFVTHPGTPRKYVTHLGPPIFRRPSTKNPDKSPLYKFCLNCSRGFCRGFCQRPGSFVWKVLSGVVYVRSRFVRIHLLHQKVKHHFKFHVSYVW